MTALVALPFAVSVLLYVGGKRLGAYLPPVVAVRLLTALALVVTASIIGNLCMLGGLVLAELPPIASLGQWSASRLRLESGMPTAAGVVAGMLAVALLAAAAVRARRATTELRRAAAAGRTLGNSPVVVVDDDVACAYAIAGRVGRVVVSTAMLGVLTPAERRALLAHESAHLHYHHHAYIQLSELAASANPLLRPVVAAVRDAAERAADEAAVESVGDRRLVARTLARAALAQSAGSGRTVLAATDGSVPARVHSLMQPPPRRRVLAAVALVALVGTCAAAPAFVAEQGQDMIESAEAGIEAPDGSAARPAHVGGIRTSTPDAVRPAGATRSGDLSSR